MYHSMKYYLMKRGGRLDQNALRVLNALNALGDGFWEVTIVKHKAVRTTEQNRYLWGVVYPLILDGLQSLGWEVLGIEEVHELMKRRYLGREVLNRNTGEVVRLGASTRDLSRGEFTTYVEELRRFAGEELNVYIPSPEEGEGIK